jgi:hypothetical protein
MGPGWLIGCRHNIFCVPGLIFPRRGASVGVVGRTFGGCEGQYIDQFSLTATMTYSNECEARLEEKTAWSVVVAYDDAAAREQAVDFCDQLVKRFWARFEFDVSWWSFGLLQNEPTTTEAAEKAAQADLVILSSLREEDFPAGVKGWIESWLVRRGDREGILAGLLGLHDAESARQARKDCYLRQIAHRSAMDYLTQVPQNIWHCMPETLDSYTQRAAQVSNVLDEILHHCAPPPVMSKV